MQQPSLEALPQDPLRYTLSFLGSADLARFARLSRRCSVAAQDERLWRAIYLAEWPPESGGSIRGGTWRRRALCQLQTTKHWFDGYSTRRWTVHGMTSIEAHYRHGGVFLCAPLHPGTEARHLLVRGSAAQPHPQYRTVALGGVQRWHPYKLRLAGDRRVVAYKAAARPGAASRVVGVWDIIGGREPLFQLQHSSEVTTADASATEIAVGLESGEVHVWSAITGDPLRVLRLTVVAPAAAPAALAIEGVAIHPASGALAVTDRRGRLAVSLGRTAEWDLVLGDGAGAPSGTGRGRTMVWSSSGRELVVNRRVGGEDGGGGSAEEERQRATSTSTLYILDLRRRRGAPVGGGPLLPAGVPLHLDSTKLIYRGSVTGKNEIFVLNRKTMGRTQLQVDAWSCAVSDSWLLEVMSGQRIRVHSFCGQ